MGKFAAEFIRGAYEIVAFLCLLALFTVAVNFFCVCMCGAILKICAKHGTRSQFKMAFYITNENVRLEWFQDGFVSVLFLLLLISKC